MAFTLASFVVDTTQTTAPKLQSFLFDTTQTTAPKLPSFATPTTGLTYPGRLPRMAFTNDGPSIFTWATAGGVKVGGTSARYFKQNGVYTYEPLTWVMSGGVKVGGAAPMVGVTVLRFTWQPAQGGVTVGGAAPSSVNFTRFVSKGGGVRVGGAAPYSYRSVLVTGSLDVTGLVATGSFAGAVSTPTVLSLTAPLVKASFTGVLINGGVLSGTAPLIQGAFAGGMTYLQAKSPMTTASFTGVMGAICSLNAQGIKPQGSFKGTVTVQGVLAGQGVLATGSFVGLSGRSGALVATSPLTQIALRGFAGNYGYLSAIGTTPSGGFTGYGPTIGTFAARAPKIQGRFTSWEVLSQIMTLVVNTITESTVMYENYPYNSFAEIDGKYYAAGLGGIYQVDIGDTDGAAAINAHVTTGIKNFDSEYMKRMTDFYMGMRSQGDIALSVYVDENDPLEYTLSPLAISTLKQRRSLIGKGARGKYWQFDIANTGGCDFDLDTINAAAVPTSRRI